MLSKRKNILINLFLLFILKNKDFINYIKLINILLIIYPGSYFIKYLNKETIYWNSITNLFIKNNVKYFNEFQLTNLPKGTIIISNHVNVTDILLIRNKINCHIISKSTLISDEFNGIKIIENEFFKNLNLIPYKRGDKKDGKNVKSKILNLIKNKKNILVFPEGTSQINCQKNILPFKKGLFHLAYENNIPILPVVIYYTDKNYGIDINTNFKVFDILNNKSNIYVYFNPIIYPKKYLSVDNLVNNTHKTMKNIIKNFNHTRPKL